MAASVPVVESSTQSQNAKVPQQVERFTAYDHSSSCSLDFSAAWTTMSNKPRSWANDTLRMQNSVGGSLKARASVSQAESIGLTFIVHEPGLEQTSKSKKTVTNRQIFLMEMKQDPLSLSSMMVPLKHWRLVCHACMSRHHVVVGNNNSCTQRQIQCQSTETRPLFNGRNCV